MGVASSDREEGVPPSPLLYFGARAGRLVLPFRRGVRVGREAGRLVFLAPATDVWAMQMFRYSFLMSDFTLGSARGAAVAALTLPTLITTAWLVRRLSRG